MLAESLQPRAAVTASRSTTIERLAGASGLLFVAVVLIQNVVRASGPSFTAAPVTVTTYFADHRVAALAPLALFPLGMVAILFFAAGIRSHAAGPEARLWADLGGLAVVVVAVLFGLVNIVETVIAATGSQLASTPEVVRALWTLHSAAFGLNLAAIAIALVGLSRAARVASLIPRWLAILALPGAGCLFAAAIGTVAIAEGGNVLYLGFLGFAVWALFLLVAGTTLIRLRSTDQ